MKLIKLILLLFPGFLLSQNIELSESIKRGKLLYQDFCVRCHLPDGKGQEGIIPPIAKSDFLFKHMEESIKKGFFSRSSLTYYSNWKPDYTILIFQEILEQRLIINNVKFPIIEDFTLVGNKQVKFTITSEFFDFYLTNTAI